MQEELNYILFMLAFMAFIAFSMGIFINSTCKTETETEDVTSETESETEDVKEEITQELGTLPSDRACRVGGSFYGKCIDHYLTSMPPKQRAQVAKYITTRTRLVNQLRQLLPARSAMFATQTVYYAILNDGLPFPPCCEQMEDLILSYFRELCHRGCAPQKKIKVPKARNVRAQVKREARLREDLNQMSEALQQPVVS